MKTKPEQSITISKLIDYIRTVISGVNYLIVSIVLLSIAAEQSSKQNDRINVAIWMTTFTVYILWIILNCIIHVNSFDTKKGKSK